MWAFQDAGEPYRRALGIDGTAGDAQDVPHPFIRADGASYCVVCGLAESLKQHGLSLVTADEVRREVAAMAR